MMLVTLTDTRSYRIYINPNGPFFLFACTKCYLLFVKIRGSQEKSQYIYKGGFHSFLIMESSLTLLRVSFLHSPVRRHLLRP